jgi:hypothetical protein
MLPIFQERESVLGYSPQTDIEEGLNKSLRGYLKHLQPIPA